MTKILVTFLSATVVAVACITTPGFAAEVSGTFAGVAVTGAKHS